MAWSGYSEQGTGSEERGPGSFAVNVPGVVNKPDGVQFVGVKASGNMQSSGRISVATANPGSDNTLTELAKLGQALLAPKIKEEQDRRFLEGMTKAASGVAMQEIIDDQPAFTKIFGDSPAVEGARAYTTAARKSAWVAEQQNRMGELAKIDTNDLAGVVQESMAAQLTGDPTTDAQLQREMLGAMPDLIRTQTKARFIHLQNEAKQARRTAMSASITEYSAVQQTDGELKTQDQMDQAEERLLAAWTPAPGVDLDSHLDDLTETLATQVGTGNFDALRFAYDMGITKQLGPDREAKLRVAALRAAPQALSKVIPKVLDEIVDLGRNPPASTEEYIARVEAINNMAAGESRVPREYGQLLSNEFTLRGVTAAANEKDRRLVGQQKAADAEVQMATLDGIIKSAILDPDASGNLVLDSLAASMPGLNFKQADIDARVGAAMLSMADPRAQATVLNRFGGDKISAGASLAQNLWDSTSRTGAKWETHGAGFDKLLQFYSGMNEASKARYFPNERQRAALDTWSIKRTALAGQPPEVQAREMQALYETRDALARTDTSRLREKPDAGTAQAAVMDVLQKNMTTGFWRADAPMDTDRLINTNVGETELAAANAVVLGLMGKQGGPGTQEQKAERAMHEALQTGLMNVHGGRLIINEVPDEAKGVPLATAVGQNPESTGMALEKLIGERIKLRGADDSTRFVVRARGLPIKYVIYAQTDDGKSITEVVTEAEVREALQPKKKQPRETIDLGPSP